MHDTIDSLNSFIKSTIYGNFRDDDSLESALAIFGEELVEPGLLIPDSAPNTISEFEELVNDMRGDIAIGSRD